MTIYTVRLEDGTVGTINACGSDALFGSTDPISGSGKVVKVNLHDENGNPIQATGKVVEILEVREEWE